MLIINNGNGPLQVTAAQAAALVRVYWRATDDNGNLVGKGGCRAQADHCFKNVEAALSAAGATLDDVTKITTFLVSAEDYPAYAAARLQLFPEDGPASSTVIITALVSPDCLVEI